MNSITRRKLFERLSYLPLLNCYIGRSLFAAEGDSTKRLVKMVFPLGVDQDSWEINAGALTSSALTAHKQLSTLAAHANDIGVIHGLNGRNVPYAHSGNTIALYTCQGWIGSAKRNFRAKGPSMDMIIADKIFDPRRNIYNALHVGVAVETTRRSHEQGYVSFQKSGDFVDMIYSPKDFFVTVFENDMIAAVASASGNQNNSNGDLEKLNQKRIKMVDVLYAQTSQIHAALSSDQKQILQYHLDVLTAREEQLRKFDPNSFAGCKIPNKAELNGDDNAAGLKDNGKQFIDLIVDAMACDISRTFSIFFNGCSSQQVFKHLDISMTHHDITHTLSVKDSGSPEKLQKIVRYYFEHFSYLLDRLKNTPDPLDPSKMLFESTVSFMSSTISNGDTHSRNNMPFVYAGGNASGLKTGKVVHASGDFGKALYTIGKSIDSTLDAVGDVKESVSGVLS